MDAADAFAGVTAGDRAMFAGTCGATLNDACALGLALSRPHPFIPA
jgi:hypothetical protein